MANEQVAERSAESSMLLTQTKLLRTLMTGTRGMMAAREEYLPRASSEPSSVYDRRLNMSYLYNGYRFAINSLSGRPFSNPLKLSEETPDVVRDWSDNIDLTGRSLHQFARDWMIDVMIAGRSHILVDKSKAVVRNRFEELELRPYLRMIRAEDIIGWKSDNMNGEEVLTQVRIQEMGEVDDPENLWATIPVKRVRVLYLDSWELWEEDQENEDDWRLVDGGDADWDRIPLVTAYGIRDGFMESEPPMEDLGWVNLGHWQSQSDQRNILHVSRVPILFGAGFPEIADGSKKIEVAANRALFSSDPGASLKYVEHTGKSIGAGRQDLKDLEEQMAVLSLSPLVPGSGGASATASALQGAESQSLLQAMTISIKEGLDDALQLMLDWQSLSGEPEVIITSEYGLALREGEHVGALLQLRLSGDISRRTLWGELRRRDVLSEQFDPEEEEQEIQDEMPGLIASMAPMDEIDNEQEDEIVGTDNNSDAEGSLSETEDV